MAQGVNMHPFEPANIFRRIRLQRYYILSEPPNFFAFSKKCSNA